MEAISALCFAKLIINANGLGRRMKLLHEAVVRQPALQLHLDDYLDLDELAERLTGIGTVLQLIGETPNAYINQEALEALKWHVQFATGIEEEPWAKEVFRGLGEESF